MLGVYLILVTGLTYSTLQVFCRSGTLLYDKDSCRSTIYLPDTGARKLYVYVFITNPYRKRFRQNVFKTTNRTSRLKQRRTIGCVNIFIQMLHCRIFFDLVYDFTVSIRRRRFRHSIWSGGRLLGLGRRRLRNENKTNVTSVQSILYYLLNTL